MTVSLKFTLNVTTHFLRTIKWNAGRDVKVDYDLILYEVQRQVTFCISLWEALTYPHRRYQDQAKTVAVKLTSIEGIYR